MGVYIKGMERPETCKLCYLSEFDPGFYAYVCKPTGIRIDYDMAKIDRPKTICPLVPIPKHGRLIDADAMIRDIEKSLAPSWYIKERNADMVKFLSLEDTIIPAEEGD